MESFFPIFLINMTNYTPVQDKMIFDIVFIKEIFMPGKKTLMSL